MWGQGGAALMWSVVVYWVCRLWGFPGNVDQGQPPPMFCPGNPASAIKQCEMSATCAGLGDSQAKLSCESKLAAASARPGAT